LQAVGAISAGTGGGLGQGSADSGAEQAQAQQASAAQRVGKQSVLRKRLEKLAALHDEFQGGRHTFKTRLEVNRSVINTGYARDFP
jgi:hypothetical protein